MVETSHCWSRALAARWPGGAASPVAREDAIDVFNLAPLLDVHGASLAGRSALAALLLRDDGTMMRRLGRRTLRARRATSCALVAQRRARCRREFFVVAAPPPAGRRSGDVMTAGLNSFRVWFGPVPGSP
ncbi:hypothetical protein F511_46338 [Dorcoceras hygrometricum]|uniref:Uncharacterized protein n=1 Tax=Dorcoceras hygrometricum TaxID=472368 RepID=A0A2Z6ZTS8_9LAMI|nr:hypothetical protein F511_46338 [Dorcoceras hygrometricum]